MPAMFFNDVTRIIKPYAKAFDGMQVARRDPVKFIKDLTAMGFGNKTSIIRNGDGVLLVVIGTAQPDRISSMFNGIVY